MSLRIVSVEGGWYMPVIPELRTLEKEDLGFKASLLYKVIHGLKMNK